jgi:hypothetical protein
MPASDYPYDPEARLHELDGLDKLRAIEDRALAELMFQAYTQIRGGGSRPRSEEAQRAADEVRSLRVMLESARAGDYGADARGYAVAYPIGAIAMASADALRKFAAGFKAAGFGRRA